MFFKALLHQAGGELEDSFLPEGSILQSQFVVYCYMIERGEEEGGERLPKTWDFSQKTKDFFPKTWDISSKTKDIFLKDKRHFSKNDGFPPKRRESNRNVRDSSRSLSRFFL